jgi:acyl-CoA hydrolase
MDEVSFHKSVQEGTVLRFLTERARTGVTSVSYRVVVFRESIEAGGQDEVFSTTVTQVCVDESGVKMPLPLSRGTGDG